MKTAQLSTDGDRQSVWLPQEFRMEGSEAFVKKIGRAVLLIPKDVDPWQLFMDSLGQFSDDFMQERNQSAGQERESPYA